MWMMLAAHPCAVLQTWPSTAGKDRDRPPISRMLTSKLFFDGIGGGGDGMAVGCGRGATASGGQKTEDPLEADPEVMAEQLLEGEPIDKQAPGVFCGGARLAMQQLGRALTVSGEKPDVDQVVALLRSGKWQDVVRQRLGKHFVLLTEHERDGVRAFAAGLAGLLLGPAGRSLGSGPECLRLRDTVAQRRIVLFSLDAGTFPDTSRRIAGLGFPGGESVARRAPRPSRAAVHRSRRRSAPRGLDGPSGRRSASDRPRSAGTRRARQPARLTWTSSGITCSNAASRMPPGC
jgi:hypothetical protein